MLLLQKITARIFRPVLKQLGLAAFQDAQAEYMEAQDVEGVRIFFGILLLNDRNVFVVFKFLEQLVVPLAISAGDRIPGTKVRSESVPF